MSDEILLQSNVEYPPSKRILDRALVSEAQYRKLHAEAVADPAGFWGRVAEEELEWFQKWDKTFEWNYPEYKWFVNGKINITHNCLDRHVRDGRGDKIAYIYSNENNEDQTITYAELLTRVKKFANGLKSLGVEKGDRVAFYMPLTIEQIVAILACARIGAVHSIIFAGFSANALRMRVDDAKAKVVMTSTWTQRRGKKLDLLAITMDGVADLDCVEHVVVHRRDAGDPELSGKQVDYQKLMDSQSDDCPAPALDAEDPLFILYTSGTTGKPKGVLHTQGGYNLYTHYTTRMSFDIHDDDIFWCTADTGWITGHSYIVYGPLSVGATSVIVEGAPDYPAPDHWWAMVDRFKVSVFYTAPTAVRLFMKYGQEHPDKHDLSTLRILGSVGEPINPEAWEWYYENIGKRRAVVVDTWWQTETGGHMIVTLPSMKQKPGKAGLPAIGIQADVVDTEGNPVEPNKVGVLVIKHPWPSALRTCYGEPERFNNYWNEMEGVYFPGDFATKDEEGYIMILGRTDDVLNVSGHRIGTAEVESALVAHASVAEAAVIGKPHEIKGESIKAFVIAMSGTTVNEELIKGVKLHVRSELGSLAVPDEIEFVEKLPKTRSGKIMRRVLKAQEMGTDVGDTSTLED